MNKNKTAASRYLFLSLTYGCLFGMMVLTLAGCKEDAKDSAHKKIIAKSTKAQALVQASTEVVPISGAEIADIKNAVDAAGPAGLTNAQKQRLAKRIVDNAEKKVDFTAFQKDIDQLTQLEKTSSDTPQARQRIYELLFLAGQELQNQYARMGDLANSRNQERLTQAQKSLNDVVNAARGLSTNNARAASVGAQFLLGSIELKKAYNAFGQLGAQDVALTQAESDLVNTMLELKRVNTEKIHVLAKRPGNTIKELQNQLARLKQQLAQVQQQVQAVKSNQQQLQQELDQNTAHARQLDQKYFDLLQKADNQLGPKRYKYQVQASLIKLPQTGKGAIYYETLVDKLTSKLAIVRSQLKYQLMRKRHLSSDIETITQKLNTLKTSPALNADIDTALAENTAARQNLLRDLQLQIENIKKMEEKYRELRVAAVEAYTSARKVYQQAARDAGTDMDTRKNAESFAQSAMKELASLWKNDVAHYKAAASLLSSLTFIPEVAQQATQLSTEYENQATEAQNAVDKLLPQIKKDKS